MPESPEDLELSMDAGDLYREEVFTDRRAGTIRRLVPVTADGDDDPSRPVRYVGQAQLMTPVGVMPLTFELDADSLKAAVERFPAGVREAVERAIEEAKELRRQASSSIVVPESGQVDLGGGLPPGGLPGGGKIKLP